MALRFLHDRGDYKTGWQLEKEWEQEQLKKKKKMEEALLNFQNAEEQGNARGDDEEEEDYAVELDESLPFACHICRQDFTNPVVTLCGHYFCQDCALQQMKEDSHCPVCQKQTSGVFNKAHRLIKQLSLKAPRNEEPAILQKKPRATGSWETVE